MSLLKVKATVRPYNLWIAAAVINAAQTLHLDADMLITAGTDGTHMTGSKHAAGNALDFSVKQLLAGQPQALAKAVRKRLGPDYDVILEGLGKPNQHLHVEWDPKK